MEKECTLCLGGCGACFGKKHVSSHFGLPHLPDTVYATDYTSTTNIARLHPSLLEEYVHSVKVTSPQKIEFCKKKKR